jgi:hypothetical protein
MFVMYSALQQLMYLNKQRSISMILFIKLIATKADIIIKNLAVTAKAINCLVFVFQRTAEQSLHDSRKRKTTAEILREHSCVISI